MVAGLGGLIIAGGAGPGGIVPPSTGGPAFMFFRATNSMYFSLAL